MKLALFALLPALALAQQPYLATSADTIWLTYKDGDKIIARSSVHGAARWTAAVVVAQSAAMPRITATPDAVVVAATQDGKPVSWRSTDSGKTWTPTTPQPIAAASLTATAPEGTYTASLDGRTLRVKLPDQTVRTIATNASQPAIVRRPWGAGVTLVWSKGDGVDWTDIVPPPALPAAPAERKQILSVLEREMYGKAPERPARQGFELRERSEDALGGKAIRKQVSIWYESAAGRRDRIELLLYLPKSDKKVPVFAGLSFGGNSCANVDPKIFESSRWQRTPSTAGSCASRWEAEYVISRGYGTAIAYYGDLDPDFDDGFRNGVHAVYGEPKADEWGAIGAWAWGMSRVMDYLEQDPQVDATHVAVNGHSRIGKAAVWAGAMDERFQMVISNNSGEGGAAISRRQSGERTSDLNRNFPHWFNANFRKYSNHEEALPFDSHWVLRATAPRLLYVTSASEDLWADPEGEFLGIVSAGMKPRAMLKPGERYFDGRFAYHLREGKHDITRWDWEGFMDFADQHGWRR